MAVVKINYIKRGKFAKQRAKETLGYNSRRPGKEKEKLTRFLFGHREVFTEEQAAHMIDTAPKGTIFYRVIISLDPKQEDQKKDLDIWKITRETYLAIEKKLGLEGKIQFIAAEHNDHTEVRHIHSIMVMPQWLSDEQFRLLSSVPREVATQQALFQRSVRDLIQHYQRQKTNERAIGRVGGQASHEQVPSPTRTMREPRRDCPECGASQTMVKLKSGKYWCLHCKKVAKGRRLKLKQERELSR